MSRWSTHCTVACRLSSSVRHLGGGLNLNMNPRARAFALAAPSCSCRCCFCCLACLSASSPFVINQPQTSDKRHLSCSHHTTHPSNTTSSSFIEISPSVLSCVHGSIDSDSSAPPLLVHPSSSSQLRRTPSLVPPPSNHIRYELDPRRINHLDTHLISDSLQRFGKNFLFILFWTYSTPRVHSGRIRIRTAWTWRKHFTVTVLETLAYTDLEHELQIKVRTTNTRRIVTNQGRTVERSTILYRKTTESKSNPINQLEAAV